LRWKQRHPRHSEEGRPLAGEAERVGKGGPPDPTDALRRGDPLGQLRRPGGGTTVKLNGGVVLSAGNGPWAKNGVRLYSQEDAQSPAKGVPTGAVCGRRAQGNGLQTGSTPNGGRARGPCLAGGRSGSGAEIPDILPFTMIVGSSSGGGERTNSLGTFQAPTWRPGHPRSKRKSGSALSSAVRGGLLKAPGKGGPGRGEKGGEPPGSYRFDKGARGRPAARS